MNLYRVVKTETTTYLVQAQSSDQAKAHVQTETGYAWCSSMRVGTEVTLTAESVIAYTMELEEPA